MRNLDIPSPSQTPHPLYDKDYPPAPDVVTQWVLDPTEENDTLDLQGAGWGTPEWQIDMSSPVALLNHLEYEISILSDYDGKYDEVVTVPEKGIEAPDLTLWVGWSSGFFHRVRLQATQVGDYYHIRVLEATMTYQGQRS